MLYGPQSSLHPFISHPTFVGSLAALPLDERVARMRTAEVRAASSPRSPASSIRSRGC
jgi:hypothetical protein